MSLSLENIGESLLNPKQILEVKKDVIFDGFLSMDGRYFVFMDEVYSTQDEKLIGNIWDNVDILNDMISNFNTEVISEEFRGDYKKLILEHKGGLINESNVVELKKTIKQLLSNKDFITEGVAIDFGNELLNEGVMSAIGGGILWVLRKLRWFAFTYVGMALDAALIATGLGKIPLVVFWALIVILDIYELVSGDWGDDHRGELGSIKGPLFGEGSWNGGNWSGWKYLMAVVDCVGLIFAGVAAKAAMIAVKGFMSAAKSAAKSLAKDPMALVKLIPGALKETFIKMIKNIPKIPKLLADGFKWIIKNFPSAKGIISTVQSKLSTFLTWLVKQLRTLTGPAGRKAAGTTIALLAGFQFIVAPAVIAGYQAVAGAGDEQAWITMSCPSGQKNADGTELSADQMGLGCKHHLLDKRTITFGEWAELIG